MVGSAAEGCVGTMCGDGPDGGASAGRRNRRPASRSWRRYTRPQKGAFDTLGTIGTVGTMVPRGRGGRLTRGLPAVSQAERPSLRFSGGRATHINNGLQMVSWSSSHGAPSTTRDRGPDGPDDPGRARVPQCQSFSRVRARAAGPRIVGLRKHGSLHGLVARATSILSTAPVRVRGGWSLYPGRSGAPTPSTQPRHVKRTAGS